MIDSHAIFHEIHYISFALYDFYGLVMGCLIVGIVLVILIHE